MNKFDKKIYDRKNKIRSLYKELQYRIFYTEKKKIDQLFTGNKC
jgi:hypothetical protein